MHRYRPARVVLLLLLGLLWAGSACAVAPEIKDEAKFFSPDAIKKANELIRQLARRTGFDLLIETLPAPPGEQADKLEKMSPADRNKFYASLAKQRANEVAVRGIYVLVTRTPPHLELAARHLPRRFTRDDFDKLRSMLIEAFRAKKYDEGLLNAVKMVQDKLTSAGSSGENLSTTGPSK